MTKLAGVPGLFHTPSINSRAWPQFVPLTQLQYVWHELLLCLSRRGEPEINCSWLCSSDYQVYASNHATLIVTIGLPIDAGDVNDHIDHVAAQFICLHVHWTAVCGDVNLTDHIEQEGLLDTRVLKTEAKKC